MRRRLAALVGGLLLALSAVGPASAAETFGTEEIRFRGQVFTDQVNQVRSPDLHHRYMFSRLSYNRALERAQERDATGTSEYPHDLEPLIDYLEVNNICWNLVGENVGFSNTIPTSPPANLADAVVDKWEASSSHNAILKDSRYDWGGGSWVRSNSGTYFFQYYFADICGI